MNVDLVSRITCHRDVMGPVVERSARDDNNYLLTYDSYGPVHNRFHRGQRITWASGGEGALDTHGPLI